MGDTKNVITLHIGLSKNQGLFIFSKVSIDIRWVNFVIFQKLLTLICIHIPLYKNYRISEGVLGTSLDIYFKMIICMYDLGVP